jgi:hypothetical protein
MINFAELKLKLCEVECNYDFMVDVYIYENKQAKIISELLEIIEMQNFSLNAYANNLPDIQDGEWIATMPPPYEKTAKITLSETESKLKQLIKGV